MAGHLWTLDIYRPLSKIKTVSPVSNFSIVADLGIISNTKSVEDFNFIYFKYIYFWFKNIPAGILAWNSI